MGYELRKISEETNLRKSIFLSSEDPQSQCKEKSRKNQNIRLPCPFVITNNVKQTLKQGKRILKKR